MQTQQVSLIEFADLIALETQLGILDGQAIMQEMMSKGLPKKIHDIRGALRLALAKIEGGLEVTFYTTDLSTENLIFARDF